jgi:hypothetical protein
MDSTCITLSAELKARLAMGHDDSAGTAKSATQRDEHHRADAREIRDVELTQQHR